MISPEVWKGILIPFAGTSLGAGCVYFMKEQLHRNVQRGLTGFAAGVMVAASIWSLLIPALEESAGLGNFAFVPAVVGFWAGILFLLLLDVVIPHLHMNTDEPEGPRSHLARTTMMLLAVTLHNIPEGMAVGTILASGVIGHLLPYFLSFAAGAMLYVVVEEMIPEMSEGEHSNIGVLTFALGFTVMMTLDVALG